MSKRVLLIGTNKDSFMLSSIRKALLDGEYEVQYKPLKVDKLSELNEESEDADIYILSASEDMRSFQDAIIYLKDYCAEHEKKLCLVGYTEEIKKLQMYFTRSLVQCIFRRPLNIKDMVEQLDTLFEKSQQEEKKKHILVVDDSGTMLRTIKSWLEGTYKVSMASSGAMAISFLATNHPDLILLDYEMPICSGPQFMEMIRAEVSTSMIPVIFLTAKGDRESVEAVLSLKPAGYLLKTMKPEEIVGAVDQFFEKRKNKTIGF